MDKMYFCVSVDDIGLDGYSTPKQLEKVLNFWDEQDLRGTLFVVPRCDGKELGEMKEYVALLNSAEENGHEIAQHGLDHTRFQTGIPPKMVLDMAHEGPAREYLAKNKSEIEASHSIGNIRAVLATGKRIIESALGKPIRGFRAPSGSICNNLFKALDTERYVYDSSRIFQEAAWELINNPDMKVNPRPINRDRFDAFQICSNTRILPISAEYTWYLKNKDYDSFLSLAKYDLNSCFAAGIPFVPVCHVSPIQEGDADCGFDLYRELINYGRSQAGKHNVSFVAETLFDTSLEVSDLFDSNKDK